MSKPLRLVPQAAQVIEYSCPLCASIHAAYVFGTSQYQIYHCAGCALTFSKKPSRGLAFQDTTNLPSIGRSVPQEGRHETLLAELDIAAVTGPVLVVADLADPIVALLRSRGLAIAKVAAPNDFASGDWDGRFQAAIVTDALMRIADPRAALARIHRNLAEGARLLLSVPLLDGRQARLMGRNWHEWQAANLWYFTRETLNLLLVASGFAEIWFRSERRRYSLDNLVERVRGPSGESLWQLGLKTLHRFSPKTMRGKEFRLPSGTAVVTGVAAPARSECVISIIVPVFNEKATLQTLMEALIAKRLPEMRKEIIVVESNSTDGSRDLVRAYEGNPEVKIVLQANPRGKGNAVREGLLAASGDIVMIQDADLEYDLDDYDGLLAPIAAWQSMFVLGSRHQGSWKMRKFNDAPFTAAVFNLGHGFFKSLMNFVLRTRMSDPFTMFKVFRRDAIFGLDFVCNRFDFDIELVIKLVRKGYIPLELPVNYVARSFAEGKKVSFTRDGLTWVWTILKFRFATLGTGRP